MNPSPPTNGAPVSPPARPMTVPDFVAARARGTPLTVLTAYDYTLARLLDAAGVDAELPVVQWQQVLCPLQTADQVEAQLAYFPIPLLVMNSEQRLSNVWQAWSEGWPGAEVRMTTWAHLEQARSVMRAPYLNQQRQWVDLLGNPLAA